VLLVLSPSARKGEFKTVVSRVCVTYTGENLEDWFSTALHWMAQQVCLLVEGVRLSLLSLPLDVSRTLLLVLDGDKAEVVIAAFWNEWEEVTVAINLGRQRAHPPTLHGGWCRRRQGGIGPPQIHARERAKAGVCGVPVRGAARHSKPFICGLLCCYVRAHPRSLGHFAK